MHRRSGRRLSAALVALTCLGAPAWAQEARLIAAARESGSTDALTFDEFLVMYVNHRPIFGVSKEQIASAFAAISTDGSGTVSRAEFVEACAALASSIGVLRG